MGGKKEEGERERGGKGEREGGRGDWKERKGEGRQKGRGGERGKEGESEEGRVRVRDGEMLLKTQKIFRTINTN